MSLKEQILADMKTAMREKNASQLESIRMLRAAIQRKEVDDRVALSDDDVMAILQKQIKQSQDAISQFKAGDRADLAEKEQTHVDNLMVYMPEQLSDEEVDAAIAAAISSTGAESMKDMGKVMGVLKAQLQGKADMGKVSGMIRAKLNA
ncbi:aspartyl-tRNA amidotransferase subunit B [Arenicella chitinivorans]|uniref:Aspartyl-tRNA amidotransferase subunit B n=1 Tax=Arenicella chitinivorans TaxID=1329800 RepID=A0A918RYC0_9GAMM|nr:GatB/YqeY domain-containing protein [Arenicella chitinivorans]GHA13457.1 aspartyl-tRNA amidotransferase subunit B [Arenicella chitinivorans]